MSKITEKAEKWKEIKYSPLYAIKHSIMFY